MHDNTQWNRNLRRLTVAAILSVPIVGYTAYEKPHEFEAGTKIRAADVNENLDELYAAVNDLEVRDVPVGTVIDWWRPDNQGIPIPDGYKVCDGSVITDPQSPLVGETVPDLTGRFVLGVTDAFSEEVGVEGGEAEHNHAIARYTGGTGGAWYFRNVNGAEFLGWNYSNGFGSEGSGYNPPLTNGSAQTLYTDMQPTLPPYVGLLKLMRIR